jgi:hypothetical protein
MTLPGARVIRRESTTPRTAPTDSGVWMAAGLSQRGRIDRPVEVRSLDEFVRKFGIRVSYSILYDCVEAFFREGGRRCLVSRVVGPAAAKATLTLSDSGAVATLRVDANGPGDWANGSTGGLKVAVTIPVAGSFQLSIQLNGVEVEKSPVFVDKVAAIAWADRFSNYVILVDLGGTNDPNALAATNLAGGTDDRGSITDTHWQAALDRISTDFGPGQISFPGRTTSVAHAALGIHARQYNRVALLDAPDVTTKAALISAHDGYLTQLALGADALNAQRNSAMFGPWLKAPGIALGSLRDIPPSPVVAGLMARSDGFGNTPNVPAAGENGRCLFAVDVKASFIDADREDLNNAGVNIFRIIYGDVRLYGYRTLTDPTSDPNYINLGNARLYMHVTALANEVAERYVFDQIDGRGIKINQYGGDLTGMLAPIYEKGSLYGSTPQEAFNVDVGPGVNTPDTIDANELHAVIALRMSPFAEVVILEITKVGVKEAVA